ncbi:MAG: hypothetical protein WC117_00355 [Sphaerochaetaceae bacterium]
MAQLFEHPEGSVYVNVASKEVLEYMTGMCLLYGKMLTIEIGSRTKEREYDRGFMKFFHVVDIAWPDPKDEKEWRDKIRNCYYPQETSSFNGDYIF